jgi:hypothetical protein
MKTAVNPMDAQTMWNRNPAMTPVSETRPARRPDRSSEK